VVWQDGHWGPRKAHTLLMPCLPICLRFAMEDMHEHYQPGLETVADDPDDIVLG
jgi:hypothetical protein